MKKRRLVFVFILIAVGAGTVLLFNNEPRARGHSLSHWLELGAQQYSIDIFGDAKHSNTEADVAVREIGARAVPILLKKLRVTDPKWREPAMEWIERNLGMAFSPGRAQREWSEAQYGFRVLGTQAAVAIPELAQMILDTNLSFNACYALSHIGRAAAPAVRIALTNSNPEICRDGIMAAARSQEIGREVIPELTALLANPNRFTANDAAMCLRPLMPPAEFVRVATNAAGPNQSLVQRVLLRGFIEARTNDSAALPVVTALLASSDQAVRELATNALIRIDPAAAVGQGIDTNAPASFSRHRGRARTN